MTDSCWNWAAANLPSRSSSLSDGNTRPLSVHPGRNIHRSQLLEEQLGCIRNVHLRDPRLVLARPTFERILLEIPDVRISKGLYFSWDVPRSVKDDTYAIGVISPQISQMCTRKASDTSNSRSFKKALAPCEIMQSRSISPKRSPPSLARPSTGCRVSI